MSLAMTGEAFFKRPVEKVEKPAEPVKEEVVKPKACEIMGRPFRFEMRYNGQRGVGYERGYGTGSLMVTRPFFGFYSWVPFLDFRGHVFTNKDPAANVGFGSRYLGDYVWGYNVYYDYRRTTKSVFRQAAVGFELLGKTVEFRANGYLPYGRKSGHYYDMHLSHDGTVLERKRNYAMRSANAELGGRFLKHTDQKVFVGIGPYYLRGSDRNSWGGKARVTVTLWDIIRLEVAATYDKIFLGIVQGEAGLTIPFGPMRFSRRKSDESCSRAHILRERAYQRVERNEIIPLQTLHRH
jgi:hypothetical protein